MRAARSHPGGEVRVEELPDPAPGPGEVVCRMLACGVCGSDVSDHYVAARLPAVLGHEPVGVVAAVGAGVSGVRKGQRVVIHHHAPCGECRRCRRGHETLCESFRTTRLHPGGFSELILVPAELVDELLPIGDLDPVLATWVEPLACVLRSQDRAGLRPGDSLLVVGAGSSGLLQVATARERAVEVVWVREPRADRRAIAEDLGADAHGNEPVDVAIVCTPNPEALAEAARSVAPGGTLCLYAIPEPGASLGIGAHLLYERELVLTASYSAGPADMRAALELLRSGAIDPLPLVTHRVPLDETARALDLQRRGEAIKAVVVP